MLVPLLWSKNIYEETLFDKLPLKFVMMAYHGCAYNIIVKYNTKLGQTKIRLHLNKRFAKNFDQDTFLRIAWAYKNIGQTIIIETFIEDIRNVTVDYKS
ncbi:MAG: hypothetical protein GY797_25745 [Deltaproteobacteria bacterium]|nr:hypothetical protein [Deltaproteobacteria bacterium]